MKKIEHRGGKRPGSGRKKLPTSKRRIRVMLSLAPSAAHALAAEAQKIKKSRRVVVENLIFKNVLFKNLGLKFPARAAISKE